MAIAPPRLRRGVRGSASASESLGQCQGNSRIRPMTETLPLTFGVTPRAFALVPCAGVGQRAAAGGPKQYAALNGRAVVAHTLQTLAQVQRLDATLVVLAPEDAVFEQHVPGFAGERGWVARCGGATRAASVTNGLQALRDRGVANHDWVLVHDAARCLLRPALRG